MKKGFTLIELFIAVIVLGITIALAVPIITKNIERSKTGEVIGNLNLIRMAEKDYFLEYATYTLNISDLNIDDPNNIINRFFNYTIPSANASDFTARATRTDGPYAGDYYEISKNGAINSSNGRFQL